MFLLKLLQKFLDTKEIKIFIFLWYVMMQKMRVSVLNTLNLFQRAKLLSSKTFSFIDKL